MCPDFDELLALAEVEGVKLHDIRLYRGDRLAARALMHSETRRHHGITLKVFELYNGKLHDYSKIYAVDADAFKSLWRKMILEAKAMKCDMICADNVLVESVPEPRVWRTRREQKIFDAEAGGGWASIYGRKSMKRFVKEARRAGQYHVEAETGALEREHIVHLGELHKRRWGFEGSSSPFVHEKRVEEYLNHPSNKHYLRVMVGDEIIACHYGMIYGDMLLWHTPVINPKYLKLSPLRVLLAETAAYCEKCGLRGMDFGLGDESYKDAYCNACRETCYCERPLSMRGFAAKVIGLAFANRYIRGVAAALIELVRKIRARLAGMKECWEFYMAESKAEKSHDQLFNRIDSWEKFCDFTCKRDFQILKWQYERFKNDDTVHFVCLADGNNIYTYGWETMRTDVVKNFPDAVKGSLVLYDFCTPEQYRNQGWYTRLLRHLANNGGGVIYVNPSNIPSKKAICAAGFKRISPPMVCA